MQITFKKNELSKKCVDNLQRCFELILEVEEKEEYKVAKTYKSWFRTKVCYVPVEEYDKFFFWYLPLGSKDLLFYRSKDYVILRNFCAVSPDKLITLDMEEWNRLDAIGHWYDEYMKGDEVCK